MGNALDPMLQTAWLDLVERAHAATPPAGQPGIHIERIRGGRPYLYHRAYDPALGKQRDRYLGPATPELRERIARQEAGQQARRNRVRVVRALVAGGLPAPPAAIGRLLAALAEAGLFRLRATLIGTHAFALYGPILGVRMPGALQATLDVDVAQPPDVSLGVDDTLDAPLLDVLRRVDPGFEPVAGLDGKAWPWRFAAPSGLRLEVLASRRGAGGRGGIVKLPALLAGGQVMDFMDYLLWETVPAVVLHDAGVPVVIPAPARFAVHKLIVAARRTGPDASKARKDLDQAALMLDVLRHERGGELAAAWDEAVARGTAWEEALTTTLARLPPALRDHLSARRS
ncbi:MAG TPA: GSU2403 family nucleotidyltransferase fold protein [Acetobacteraceae bacterium]|nr:GSU2403 family nucleotidyltransferase fold protein [Acetobacteraceae bacterium]